MNQRRYETASRHHHVFNNLLGLRSSNERNGLEFHLETSDVSFLVRKFLQNLTKLIGVNPSLRKFPENLTFVMAC